MPVMENGVKTGNQEPVAIGKLERFATDYHREHSQEQIQKTTSNGIKIAVVGSGPAGIACGESLAKKGYEVTIFEANHLPGGVLTYGIPEFRLPKSIVKAEIDNLTSLGVNIVTDIRIGEEITVDQLLEEQEFSACFIATGAEVSNWMGIENEDALGVFSADDFLKEINTNSASEIVKNAANIVVVGGGNVAMDACGCAIRLNDRVTCVYRRSKAEMPAKKDEIETAKEEGVQFSFLTNPVEVLKDENGYVRGLKCTKMMLGDPDESGRRRSLPIEGSEFEIEADLVIMAIGNSPDPVIKETTRDLETDRRGYIIIDPQTQKTSKDHVYAGGDNVTGVRTVVLAMAAGKRAAEAIDALFVSQRQ